MPIEQGFLTPPGVLNPEVVEDSLLLLKEMIAIPSLSREETKLADHVEAKLKSFGLKPNRLLNNIWIKNTHFDNTKPTILLNSHIDTVKPNTGYTNDPFDARETDGKIYGLGSNDAGASVVSLLAVFRHFCEEANLNYNLVFAASAEEEISGLNGIEILLKSLPKIDCAMVGEPTGMQMAVAEKGLLVLDCTVHGRSGHAAREEGENAIYKAMADLEWFRDFRFERVSPLLGPNKMTVTVIQSGTQHNVVPEACNFTVDVRLNELYDFETVLSTIREKVKGEVKPRSTRIKSTSIALDHPLVRAGLALGRTHYGSPTTSDKALMPFPALKMGPGESSRSHTANEFVLVDEIKNGIELYRALLQKVLKDSQS
jgi:acetylornithine deacetylase